MKQKSLLKWSNAIIGTKLHILLKLSLGQQITNFGIWIANKEENNRTKTQL
jgi:hypothetical protein